MVSGFIMVLTLFVGESILAFFGIDIESFAVAGAIIIFLIGMEMILERNIFKTNPEGASTTSIVPLAFPMIAGAGTMTTIISLRAEFTQSNVLVGILLNLALVYLVLKTSGWLERKIGQAGFNILRKVFGIILLSIAIKLFKTNFHILA